MYENNSDGRKIGKLLGTRLTSDGVNYVKEAVAKGGLVAEFWQSQFDWIDWDRPRPCCSHCLCERNKREASRSRPTQLTYCLSTICCCSIEMIRYRTSRLNFDR